MLRYVVRLSGKVGLENAKDNNGYIYYNNNETVSYTWEPTYGDKEGKSGRMRIRNYIKRKFTALPVEP